MQKYVLVKLLEEMAEGAEFSSSSWPLHVTLVSNFAVDWGKTGLFEKLVLLLARQASVTTTAANDEYFGDHKQVHVITLNMNDELMKLHTSIMAVLKGAGVIFDEPQYLNEGFRAHATIQPKAQLNKGDRLTIDELTIIDMFPRSDIHRRKILKTIKFAA